MKYSKVQTFSAIIKFLSKQTTKVNKITVK